MNKFSIKTFRVSTFTTLITSDQRSESVIRFICRHWKLKASSDWFCFSDLQGETILQACFVAEPAGLTHKEPYVCGRPSHKIWTPTFVCQTMYLGRPFITHRGQDWGKKKITPFLADECEDIVKKILETRKSFCLQSCLCTKLHENTKTHDFKTGHRLCFSSHVQLISKYKYNIYCKYNK